MLYQVFWGDKMSAWSLSPANLESANKSDTSKKKQVPTRDQLGCEKRTLQVHNQFHAPVPLCSRWIREISKGLRYCHIFERRSCQNIIFLNLQF